MDNIFNLFKQSYCFLPNSIKMLTGIKLRLQHDGVTWKIFWITIKTMTLDFMPQFPFEISPAIYVSVKWHTPSSTEPVFVSHYKRYLNSDLSLIMIINQLMHKSSSWIFLIEQKYAIRVECYSYHRASLRFVGVHGNYDLRVSPRL